MKAKTKKILSVLVILFSLGTVMNIIASYSREQKTVEQQVNEELKEQLGDEIATRLSLEERKAYFSEILRAEDVAMAEANAMKSQWDEKVQKAAITPPFKVPTKEEQIKFMNKWKAANDRGNAKAELERKRIMEEYSITEEEDRMIQNEAMTSDEFSDIWE